MSWTLEDNMVDSTFFCAGETIPHLCKHAAETSDTGVEAVEPNPCCS